MDQTVALHSTEAPALLIDFSRTSEPWSRLDLRRHTLLVTDAKVSHALSNSSYGSRRADCESAAPALGVPTLRRPRSRPSRPFPTTGSGAAPGASSPRSRS